MALTRACPFYEGRMDGFAARTVHYRGILGFEGLYTGLGEVGGLSAYASRVEDLVDQQRARYRAWFAAMDLAGVERRLFAQAGGNLHGASWNPVRLSHHGTVEIRSMDANFPEMVLAVCALIRGAAERVRRERLEVRPGRGVLALEPDGDLLHVPIFSYLNGELLGAAVSRGVQDQRVEAYVDSVVRFASPYLERPELVEVLGSSGSYRTTEAEILESFPAQAASLTREQGLSLVREACLRLKEQVSSLRRKYDETPPGDERNQGVARVIDIRRLADRFRRRSAPRKRARCASIGESGKRREPHEEEQDRAPARSVVDRTPEHRGGLILSQDRETQARGPEVPEYAASRGARLEGILGRVSDAPLRDGNSIQLLKNGPDTYDDWLQAIGEGTEVDPPRQLHHRQRRDR